MKEKMKIDDVYVCDKTGNPHYCGEMCDKTTENMEGVMVCEYTGLCKKDVVGKSNHYSSKGDADTVRQGFQLQSQNQQGKLEKYDINSAFFLNKDQLVSIERNSGSQKSERQKLLTTAYAKIRNLLSNDQIQKEEEYRDAESEAEINSQIQKYVTKCNQGKKMICLEDIFMTCTIIDKKMVTGKEIRFFLTRFREHREIQPQRQCSQ